ncbi:MAG: N-acetylglucosamine-6-phosphate deacetylase [Clostridiales bacterium]|nr:N-acetylglucosamine-6-phosphate deacetylase [Clostridiales bacterium]
MDKLRTVLMNEKNRIFDGFLRQSSDFDDAVAALRLGEFAQSGAIRRKKSFSESSRQVLSIVNANIVFPDRIMRGSVTIEKGVIGRVSPLNEAVGHVVDAEGLYLSPGFIDLHVHGGNGSDFMDATPADFSNITRFHASHGTTSMLATTLTSLDEELFAALDCYNSFVKTPYPGSRLLGLHLEGPYFAAEQCGAQDPKYLKTPDPSHYTEILGRSAHIRRWSAAPELDGIRAFAKTCRERRIVLSMAHTSCTAAQAADAYQNDGFSLITHFYSAMNGVTRKNCFRVGGLVEAGYLLDGLNVEIIADGCHLPPELLNLVIKVKGCEHVALVTDCSAAAGTTDGSRKIGSRKNGQPVVVKDGVAFLADFSAFAGSVATTDRLLETILNQTRVSIPQAVGMLTKVPAGIMSCADKGEIRPGADADLALFSYRADKIEVKKVFIAGEEFVFPSP